MLRKHQAFLNHRYTFFIKALRSNVYWKRSVVAFFCKALLLICIIGPVTASAQEAGCLEEEILYVKINTVPPTINATPADFTVCTGSYTYQWQVSTDNIHFTDLPGATSQNLEYSVPVTEIIYFLRKATCGSVTKYTNSVTVYPVYTPCTDFGLSLAGTTGNALATIKAGLVTTTTSSTIGEFVIEWYREVVDGEPEFTSGSAGATDPSVTVSHPFDGEPAEGGTWHPVIKYVYIDGIKYSRTNMPGARHSPDLLHCLDPIIVIVDNLTCSNGSNFNVNGLSYIHKVTYTNGLVSPTLASRSLRFDLDATNKFFAWYFNGYTVADNLKITYVSPANETSTVLEYWKIGMDAGGTDVTVSPKLWTGSGRLHKVISLDQFVFAEGDYLRIEITPGANSNTNWEFYCKCFTTLDCNIWDSDIRTIQPGSVAMTWNSSLCQYEVTYNKTTWTNPGGSNLLPYHYYGYFIGGGSMSGVEPWTTQTKLILRKTTSGRLYQTAPTTTCGSQSGSTTTMISKNGSVVTAAFSNGDDYNFYKSSYQSALNHSGMSNYTTDNTLIDHYKTFLIRFVLANSCGDTRIDKYFYTHYSSPPVFNDGTKTITINLASVSNNYSAVNSCDNSSQTINALMSTINVGISEADFSYSTNVSGGANPIVGVYAGRVTIDDTGTPRVFTASARVPGLDVCDLTAKGWSDTRGLNANQWQFDIIWDRVTVTDTADPINNFKLERLMDNNGVPLTPGNYITVYEIINGVVQ